MLDRGKILTIESTAIVLLWTLAVISPLLFMDEFNQNWRAVNVMWAEYSVVGFVFLINRFLLMPHLFFKKHYVNYIFALIILFILLSLFILYCDGVNMILALFYDGYSVDQPIPPMGGSMGGMHMYAPPSGMHHMAPTPPALSIIPPAFSVLILAVIVLALDMGLSIAVKLVIAEHTEAQIHKERIMAQLSNLQSQVSPHFFMNTLNNIHALVDIDPQRAKQTIIELSSLMDYLLYDSSNQKSILVQKELDFISSYVNLMRLRFSEQVRIEFILDGDIPAVKIPPLLFLNFIENAFKYGVDYERESFIKIRFQFNASSIEMISLNSNHSLSVKRKRNGIGISNSIKRLELLYADKYSLDICEKEKIYYVNLKIPIQ